MRGIGDKLAVNAANAHRAERTGPRNIADHKGRARANDAQDVRVVFAVGAEQNGLDLDFVIPDLGKERTNGRSVRRQVRISFSVGRPSRHGFRKPGCQQDPNREELKEIAGAGSRRQLT